MRYLEERFSEWSQKVHGCFYPSKEDTFRRIVDSWFVEDHVFRTGYFPQNAFSQTLTYCDNIV